MECNAARQVVQAGLDLRRSESRYHREDKEVFGVIAGKHEAERQSQELAQQQRQAKVEEIRRQIREEEERIRQQEEADQAERAECRHDFMQAVMAAGVLCGLGGLHLIGAWNPDAAVTIGGVLMLCGLTVIGIGLLRWRSF